MRKLNSQFVTRFISEPGLDGQNGTYYGFVEMDQYYCMAVAEGYDGEGGRDSAKLAVDSAIEAFIQKPGMSAKTIRNCLRRADRSLLEASVRIRLKAGILLIVSDYTRLRYGVCGNVMLYALRNAGIFHQSVTQTVYQSMLDERTVRSDTSPAVETKNLYHYLGGSGTVTVSGKLKLEDGDLLLAVTESFWSRVNKVEILDAYESIQSEEEFLEDLQELYLRGNTDSIPCCCMAVLSIKKAYKENTALKKKIRLWCLIAVLVLAVGGTILYFVVRSRRSRQREIRNTVEVYEDTGDQYMEQTNCPLARQEYEKAGEAGKKLSKNEEKLEREKRLSDKINISTLLENADKAYEAQNYTQARSDYKKALSLVGEYAELASLTVVLDQRLKRVSTGMEINNYIQNAALREAAGELEAAQILYERAEAMLRIVDDPERLQQVQLAELRIQSQAAQEDKKERAKERDAVITEADESAAMDAVLDGDLELAVELYTKIRDAYVAMEENEKAEQTTAILKSLQKQTRAAEEEQEAQIESDKNAALNAVLDGDLATAIELYTKVQNTYLELEQKEKAEEIAAILKSLEKQAGNSGPGNAQPAGPASDIQGKNKAGGKTNNSMANAVNSEDDGTQDRLVPQTQGSPGAGTAEPDAAIRAAGEIEAVGPGGDTNG